MDLQTVTLGQNLKTSLFQLLTQEKVHGPLKKGGNYSREETIKWEETIYGKTVYQNQQGKKAFAPSAVEG